MKFSKGQRVCWIDYAKPGGKAGWQKVGTITSIEDAQVKVKRARVRREDGKLVEVPLDELYPLETKPPTKEEELRSLLREVYELFILDRFVHADLLSRIEEEINV